MDNFSNSSSNIFTDAYNYYLWTLTIADTRTKGWLMVDSPTPTLIYTALYLILVVVGPRLMKSRKPMSLRGALLLYNIFMAGLNLYIAVELLIASTRLQYSYVCQPMTYINNKEELRVANGLWWYYFSKLLEFCDTLFFILRKKEEQLTFLHVYHHSTMFSLWWIGIKWVPSGSSFLPAMVNSFVHVLMYSYYALAALGPRVTPYLWWKKYLTIIQLIQFTTALVMGINGIRRGCDFPLWMQYALVAYMLSFILLFGKFYAKAYMKEGMNAVNARPGSITKRKTSVDDDNNKGGLSEPCHVEASKVTNRANNGLLTGSESTNGSANGSANGAANGKANGSTNGYANGTANGSANTHLKTQ